MEYRVQDLEDARVREELKAAQIVFGIDDAKRTRHLFFGEAKLRGIVRRGVAETLSVTTFVVDVSEDSDELEYLIAAVTTLKGSCCYGSAHT